MSQAVYILWRKIEKLSSILVKCLTIKLVTLSLVLKIPKGIILVFFINVVWTFIGNLSQCATSIWRMRETFRPIQKAMLPEHSQLGGPRFTIGGMSTADQVEKRRHQWWHFSFRDDKTIIPIQHAFAGSQSRCVSVVILGRKRKKYYLGTFFVKSQTRHSKEATYHSILGIYL